MTSEEAKRALLERCPVVSDGIEYLYVDEVIYKLDKQGKLTVILQMLDKCGHSVSRAPMSFVELKGKENEQ